MAATVQEVGGYELRKANAHAYGRSFFWSHVYGMVRAKIGAFIAEPKRIRLRHFRALAAMIGEVIPGGPGRKG